MNNEYRKFKSLATEWWEETGKFSVLHRINPLRIKYIVDQIINIKKKKNISKRNYKKINIIDIGCGGGLVCEPLARMGFKVSGVDFIKKNIKIARNHALKEKLNINYFEGNINKLKLKEKYDIILLLEVVEHLDNWQKIIDKFNYYLKPKGLIIISTINRNIYSALTTIFFAEKILRWIPKGTHNYSKLVKPEELISSLKQNKFKLLDITGLVYNPISRSWNFSKNNTKVNYFCTAQKN